MHLKHKVRTWKDLVGNNHIKKALGSYTYDYPLMFEGEKGCAKTSIAYLLANEYGVDPNNIEEFNCGINNDVKSNREKASSLNDSTIFGYKKVVILNEVHRLSSAAEDAWLVPLENLRKGVIVFACTTETGKLSDAFLRRFVRYKVKPITDEQSIELIHKICDKENITLPKWLKALIVEKSEGIPGHILTAIPKILNVDDQDEAKQLLDLSTFDDIDTDVYNLFSKIYLTKTVKWCIIVSLLDSLLTKFSVEKIKADMMNIIGFRLKNNHSDGSKLCRLFDMINESSFYLERAGMYVLMYKLFQIARE